MKPISSIYEMTDEEKRTTPQAKLSIIGRFIEGKTGANMGEHSM
jgi:hypothetical protein